MQGEVRALGRPAWELRGEQANPGTGSFVWAGEDVDWGGYPSCQAETSGGKV